MFASVKAAGKVASERLTPLSRDWHLSGRIQTLVVSNADRQGGPQGAPVGPLASLSGWVDPSIWWLETTHFIAVTRHDGAARPQPLDLFPALCSSTPRPREAVCRTLGESIDLPRVDGLRDADVTPCCRFSSFLWASLSVTISHTLTLT
ncbi:hypothetical protein JOQ06_000391, partial [Pogonophryne albipinna]